MVNNQWITFSWKKAGLNDIHSYPLHVLVNTSHTGVTITLHYWRQCQNKEYRLPSHNTLYAFTCLQTVSEEDHLVKTVLMNEVVHIVSGPDPITFMTKTIGAPNQISWVCETSVTSNTFCITPTQTASKYLRGNAKAQLYRKCYIINNGLETLSYPRNRPLKFDLVHQTIPHQEVCVVWKWD